MQQGNDAIVSSRTESKTRKKEDRVNFILPSTLRKRLSKYLRETGVRQTDCIRIAVSDFLTKNNY